MSAPLVRELTPGVLGDWLNFFDHDAFADNPGWAGCYCHFFHANHAEKDWDQRSAEENRAASSELILSGRMKGYLAYVCERAVGWCQAAPRSLIPNLANDKVLGADSSAGIGSVVCFVVARPHRGLGIARLLLEAACAGFRAQGLLAAEAYPRAHAQGDAANYHGPLNLYSAAGFSRHLERDGVLVVRRDLGARPPGR